MLSASLLLTVNILLARLFPFFFPLFLIVGSVVSYHTCCDAFCCVITTHRKDCDVTVTRFGVAERHAKLVIDGNGVVCFLPLFFSILFFFFFCFALFSSMRVGHM